MENNDYLELKDIKDVAEFEDYKRYVHTKEAYNNKNKSRLSIAKKSLISSIIIIVIGIIVLIKLFTAKTDFWQFTTWKLVALMIIVIEFFVAKNEMKNIKRIKDNYAREVYYMYRDGNKEIIKEKIAKSKGSNSVNSAVSKSQISSNPNEGSMNLF